MHLYSINVINIVIIKFTILGSEITIGIPAELKLNEAIKIFTIPINT